MRLWNELLACLSRSQHTHTHRHKQTYKQTKDRHSSLPYCRQSSFHARYFSWELPPYYLFAILFLHVLLVLLCLKLLLLFLFLTFSTSGKQSIYLSQRLRKNRKENSKGKSLILSIFMQDDMRRNH